VDKAVGDPCEAVPDSAIAILDVGRNESTNMFHGAIAHRRHDV
jgi:hypothetical protein